MKILNLYAGIGGNRKLWGDEHEITAIENVPEIAKIYQDFFPKDKVIIADAHQYLLDHYKEFDFIWSSPPCPTHSDFAKLGALSEDYGRGNHLRKAKYPEMGLYQEVILLQHFYKGKWIVENVIPYYKPLIEPQIVQRHCFWANFLIHDIKIDADKIKWGKVKEWQEKLGFNLEGNKGIDKRKVLRNCVRPEIGLHIFQEAFREYKTLL